MNVQRLPDDFANRHARVERSGGILKNQLHLAPERQHIDRDLLLAVENGLAIVNDLSGGRFIQTQNRSAQRGFAAAGLADNAERLAFINMQRYILNRLNIIFS